MKHSTLTPSLIENGNSQTTQITGRIRWDDNLEPVEGAEIEIIAAKSLSEPAHDGHSHNCSCKLSGTGQFNMQSEDIDRATKTGTYSIIVKGSDGRILYQADAGNSSLRKSCAYDILISASLRPDKIIQLPTVKVGDIEVNAEQLRKAQPEDILTIARALVDPKVAKKERKKIVSLSEKLLPASRDSKVWICETPILHTIYEIIELKKWPREVALKVEDILHMRWTGFAEQTHECANFRITYQDSGTAAVPSSTAAQDVLDPGSNPPVVLASLPAGGVPTYIKRICFWLERALASYINAPFSMLNPAASGKIPVVVNSGSYGSASPSGTFYLNNNLDPDVLCAVAVHELFHMVQYEYGGSGTWRSSVFEGGAVFAEDSAADLMNRYIDETRTNFNGTGVMANTNLSLNDASYKTSLFWRYIAEQHSGDTIEPFVGVETYRKIIEKCAAGSYSNNDVKAAIRELPWYQDFHEFHYLDPARQDLTNGETTLGNYALACYLKDLGVNKPDSRFDFIEDEENIHIDNVIGGVADITSMPSVTVTSTMNLTNAGSSSAITQIGTVNDLASRYYELNIDPAVTNVQVEFIANAGFNSHVFQIVQVDEDGNVRDIHRTDKSSYTKTITNERGGKKLDRLVVVVSGGEDSGGFIINFNAVAPSPDVMVTRWHSAMKREYEINSKNWAWTWVSPDIWVDNDENGVADSEVFFNFNNKLNIRLHNKGNAEANNIQVSLFYQNAAGGLSNAAWLPVRNTMGDIQTLTGLSLPAGNSSNWSVDWSPLPDGVSNHFCIRAVVTVPGDPNTDNKRVLSNFGNVKSRSPYFDLTLLRRNTLDLISPVVMKIIPRLPNYYQISQYDVKRLEVINMKPAEVLLDEIRIYKGSNEREIHKHEDEHLEELHQQGVLNPCLKTQPDLQGDYKTLAEALPPGVAGRPMVTVVHEVDGIPLGGVTFLLSEK